MNGPPVTVAVVSWNTRELLDGCLGSLRGDAEAGRAAVWVVDNASGDGSAEMVQARHPWVSLIASERNLGFGAAVNLVAERTDSDWVAPANADVRLRPHTLSTLLSTGSARPDVGVLAPALIGADGHRQRSAYAFPSVAYTLRFNLGLASADDTSSRARGRCTPAGPGSIGGPVDWALGAFLLVRRRLWSALGGFDPAIWMHAEDLDLCWRAAQSGASVWFEPAAEVVHVGAAATRQRWGAALDRQTALSTYAWMLRRQGGLRTRTVAALNMAGATARALALTVSVSRRTSMIGNHAAGRERRWHRDQLWRWARVHAVGLAPRRHLEGHQ